MRQQLTAADSTLASAEGTQAREVWCMSRPKQKRQVSPNRCWGSHLW